MRNKSIIALRLIAAAIFVTTPIAHATGKSSSKTVIQTIDAHGNVDEYTWPVKAQARWVGATPTVELLIHVPEPYSIEAAPGAERKFPAQVKEVAPGKGKTYLAQKQGNAFAYPVLFKTAPGGKGNRVNLLVIPPEEGLPLENLRNDIAFQNASCAAAGVEVTSSARSLTTRNYIAVACQKTSEAVILNFVFGPDIELAGEAASSRTIQKVFRQPLSGWLAENLLTELTFKEKGQQQSLKMRVMYKAPVTREVPTQPPKRLSFGASASLGYLSYSEPFYNLTMKELTLNGKFEPRYWLIIDKFDLVGSFYATLLPVTLSGSAANHPSSRLYGADFRAGYWLGFGNIKIGGYAGWHSWGMLVSGRDYGVKALSGPQLLLSVLGPPSEHPISGYIKASTISTGSTGGIGANYEYSAGGSYELTKLRKTNPLKMLLDFTKSAGRAADRRNSYSLFMTSLGVGVEF